MEIASQLIRTVARMFYDTKYILIIDALHVHSTLLVEDLASILHMNTKEVRKLCQRLREDKMVTVHTRPEMRPGHARPTNKDYYFIHFHNAINAIKYRVVKVQQIVKERHKPTQERKDYYCERCKAEFTQMEVLAHIDPSTGEFVCANCAFVLERHEISAEDAAGSAHTRRLNEQLKPLVLLLQQIDSVAIPVNDFEEAHSRHKDIPRSETNPGVEWRAVVKDGSGADTVRGIKVDAPTIQVDLTSAAETKRQADEMRRKKAEQQAANALPEWYTRSTVTGQKTMLGEQEAERMRGIREQLGSSKPTADDADETKPAVEEDNEHVRAYYEELRREHEREARKSVDSMEEDDEEDDDGFEDVPAANGTPASLASTGSRKRKAGDMAAGDDDDEGEEEDDDDDAGDFEDAL